MKLLIVEDDTDSRIYLERSLKTQGYSLETAVNGIEALKKVKSSPPDLIISDILMPEMDGFEFCRRIKKDDKLRTIPFVFYTATYVDQQDEDLAMSLGASRFVVKPMEMDSFLALIQEVLEEHKKHILPVPDSVQAGDEELEQKHSDALIRKLDKKVKEIEQERLALKESYSLINAIIEGTTDAIFIKDKEGRYIMANHITAKAMGKPVNEVLGKKDTELFSQEAATGLMQTDRKIIETGETQSLEEVTQVGNTTQYWHTTKGVHRDSTGKIAGLFGIAREITEKKKMEDSLRKLSRVVEQSPLSIIITDTEGKIEYVNPYFTKLTGYPFEEALGVYPNILKSGLHPPELYDELWKTITSGNVWRGQFHNKKKTGELYWEDAAISPITDEKGIITNYIAIKEDITERKSLENQLLQSQKMEAVGRLAGGIAHDFNNILSAIMSYAYLASMSAGDNLNLKNNLDQITFLTSRAGEITKGLLAFSRKQPYNPEPLNINKKILDTEKLLRKFMGEDIELKIKIADRDLFIIADSIQIEQIIINLATNARDAMHNCGMLSIEIDIMTIDDRFIRVNKFGEPGTYAVIAVSDTGSGLDEKIKQQIFEPFFTTKEVGKGTGLGLSIIYGIVKQHEGYINVYSELGFGTTFKLYFKTTDTEAIEQIKEETVADLSGNMETILLAEDEEAIRTAERIILQEYNYRVIEAVDGQDAIDQFIKNENTIQLCIIDAVMPRKNGREAIDAIRRIKPDMNLILTSGYSADVISDKGILQEGLEFLPKPLLPDNLLKTIKKVLNQ